VGLALYPRFTEDQEDEKRHRGGQQEVPDGVHELLPLTRHVAAGHPPGILRRPEKGLPDAPFEILEIQGRFEGPADKVPGSELRDVSLPAAVTVFSDADRRTVPAGPVAVGGRGERRALRGDGHGPNEMGLTEIGSQARACTDASERAGRA